MKEDNLLKVLHYHSFNQDCVVDIFHYLLSSNPEIVIEDKNKYFRTLEYGKQSKEYQAFMNKEYNRSDDEKLKRINDIFQKIRNKKDW